MKGNNSLISERTFRWEEFLRMSKRLFFYTWKWPWLIVFRKWKTIWGLPRSGFRKNGEGIIQRMTKKAILAVRFGTTHHAESKTTIEAIENMAAERFPGYEVRGAYTSEIVRKVLKKRDGLHVDNTWEALENLRKDLIQEVIIQRTQVMLVCS
jgi:hypothetical protein